MMYFVYKQIDVVKEERLYPSWNKDLTNPDQNINLSFGITNGKRLLNNLHYELAMGGYKEVKPQVTPRPPSSSPCGQNTLAIEATKWYIPNPLPLPPPPITWPPSS